MTTYGTKYENGRDLDPVGASERPRAPSVDDERLLAEADKFSATTARLGKGSNTPIRARSTRCLIDLEVPDEEIVDLTPLARQRAARPGAAELAECAKRIDRCEGLIETQVDILRSLTDGMKANAEAIRRLRIAIEVPQTESQSVQASGDDIALTERRDVPKVVKRTATAKPELAVRPRASRRKGSAPDGTSTVSVGRRPNTRASKRPHSLTQAEVEQFILRQRKDELSGGSQSDEPIWSAIAQVFRLAGSDHQGP